MAQASRRRAQSGADRFFEPAVQLLRTVASDLAGEPGLWYGRGHVVYESETESGVRTLGRNDAITQAREPDFWDLLLYHRALISMLTTPGRRSGALAYDVGRAALRGFASKENIALDDMVTAVLGSFAARTRPVEIGRFPPDGDNLNAIVRHALGYSIGAMRMRARDYVRELRAQVDVDPDTLPTADDEGEMVPGSLRGEPTCFGAGGVACA